MVIAFWVNSSINQDTQKLNLLAEMYKEIEAWKPAGPSIPAIDLFEQNLLLLLDGGTFNPPEGMPLKLPASVEKELSQALQEGLTVLPRLRAGGSPQAWQDNQLILQSALDQAAHLIELHRSNSLGMARGLYAALFLSTTCFLLIGLWFTEELIAKPLEELVHLNYRIAAGDLDTPIILRESDEFDELAKSFEAMRLELRDSRARLSSWTSELEKRVARRTQQLAALSQVVTTASRSQDLEQVLRTALEQSLQVLGLETGGLWLVDEASDDLHLTVSQGMSDEMKEMVRLLHKGEGVTGRAALSGEMIVVEDINLSPQGIRIIATMEDLQSLVAIPIKIHDRVVGVLDVMTHHKRAYSADEIALLNSIGQQIAIGVENARLIEEIRQQTERVATLQERSWISAELHDGLLQTLGYLHLKVDQLEFQALNNHLPEMAGQLAHQRLVLEQTSGDIRHFISNLREAPPPPMSLEAALQKMVTTFMQEVPMQVKLAVSDPPLRLNADHVAHLVRIAREAVINASRHGSASHAMLSVTVEGDHGELNVTDNGSGFQIEMLPEDGREHLGLDIMRARAIRIGGQLSVKSMPGQGTCISVTWPLETV